MTYAREKRLALAWLALLAPLPLPFSQVLEWPALFLYSLALVVFVQRVENDRAVVLPNWVLNLLGLAYLPVLVVDLRLAVVRGRVVTALLHLIMFLILAKVWSMRHEKDKWHILVAVFFLFIGGMATATHLTVSLYLLAFLLLSFAILARFVHLRELAAASGGATATAHPSRSAASPGRLALRWPIASAGALVLILGVPTFASLPRFREPFLLGPGGSIRGLVRTTGFSDSVDLSQTSSIRGNREVALRLRFLEDDDRDGVDLRIKGAVYDVYDNLRWYRLSDHFTVLDRDRQRGFKLFDEEPVATVEIFRERLNSGSLLLPLQAVSVQADFTPALIADLGGGVALPFRPMDTVRYRVGLADGERIRARWTPWQEAEGEPGPLAALDSRGITDAMRELAREVMGSEDLPAAERIRRLEEHLLTGYTYTTIFVGREGFTPLEDFLFDHKSGHCEFFASAMVLLLRAEGIPARLATGYLGAEYNPLEGYFMVRQENAHAWVEARVPGLGWRVFDPTPPEGRPGVRERGFALLMSQIYDYLTFRWDMWVLTYGAEDQRSFFESLRESFAEWWERWKSPAGETAPREPGSPALTADNTTRIREDQLWMSRGVSLAVAASLFAAALGALLWWQHGRRLTAEGAYLHLRRQLARSGLRITASTAPLALRDDAVARYPSAAPATRELVALYLRASFADKPLSRAESAGLRRVVRQAVDGIRRDAAERSRRPGPAAA